MLLNKTPQALTRILSYGLATLLLAALVAPQLQAQTLNVLHSFAGTSDGLYPVAGLTIDSAGSLYGTTAGLIYTSGPSYGSVFRLKPHNGAWLFSPLYDFTGGNDGAYPLARVVLGSNGTLYGTVNRGGVQNCMQGCGLVFNLRPRPAIPPSPLTPWNETVLYSFQGSTDGAYPGYGDIAFDAAGNIYNTGSQGGINNCPGHVGCGVVYKLTRSGSNYTESPLYAFTAGTDGAFPIAAVAIDHSGNLYTTAYQGGTNNGGTVIQLAPSGGGYNETTIHQFIASTDGDNPWTGVLIDSSGNLFGGTSRDGIDGGGSVYEMSPSGGGWNFSVLQSFNGSGANPGPQGVLTADASGNLYGTIYAGGAHNYGAIFELRRSGSSFTYIDLYDFTGGSDGGYPASTVTLDSVGNLYGTAYQGGTHNYGVVWQLVP